MNRPASKRPDDVRVPDAAYIGSEIHRRLAVRGSAGVDATVLVLVRNGRVRLSVEPHLTWEAVMAPTKVDELVRTLQIARDDAATMAQRHAAEEHRQAEA